MSPVKMTVGRAPAGGRAAGVKCDVSTPIETTCTRAAGATALASATADGQTMARYSGPEFFSAGLPGVRVSSVGPFVAFNSRATLVPGDTNGVPDVFVWGPDRADTAADLTGDGDLDDTVLEVLDTRAGPGPATRSPIRARDAKTNEDAVARGRLLMFSSLDGVVGPS